VTRRVLSVLLVACAAGLGALWFAHRSTAVRTLELVRLPVIRDGLQAGREAAQAQYRAAGATGASTQAVEAQAARLDRALTIVEELDVLTPQVDADLLAHAALPFALLLLSVAVTLAGAGKVLLAPLEAISKAVRRHAAGDASGFPLPPTGSGDTRELSAALNEMVSTLAAQRATLERQSRMIGWRDVALEVSHEMKNLVTPLQLSAEGVAEQAAKLGGDLSRQAPILLEAVAALRRLNRVFVTLAALPAPELRRVDLSAVLESAAALQRPRGLAVQVESTAERIIADERMLKEAVTNLVINAAEAGASLVQLSAVRSGGEIVISCADDGSGLAGEPLQLARRPGYSTKPGGSGFGLYFVDRMCTRLGGRLELAPRSPRGTTVRMVLPDGATAAR
jgi:nitrogen fixation/metabolism regulation signal transduction histidine kinase